MAIDMCAPRSTSFAAFWTMFLLRVGTLEFTIAACRLSCRKDPHGFFAFPVTDAIAPGYSSIIKHPMDFSTMKDKIKNNEYNTVTEFKVRTSCCDKKKKIQMDTVPMKDLSSFFLFFFFLQADFKLMCDNAMVYNRPETVYYKAAKKLLHTGFKMMSKVTAHCLEYLPIRRHGSPRRREVKHGSVLAGPCLQERLLALKRSMSFMQDMDYTQQAAILGDEDLAADIPPPEIVPLPVESAKKSKKQPVKVTKEVIRYGGRVQGSVGRHHRGKPWNWLRFSPRWSHELPLLLLYVSYLYEPEGNACSLTDSTAEEHVLALVEHSADEARDRINRYMPCSKVLQLKPLLCTSGSLWTVAHWASKLSFTLHWLSVIGIDNVLGPLCFPDRIFA